MPAHRLTIRTGHGTRQTFSQAPKKKSAATIVHSASTIAVQDEISVAQLTAIDLGHGSAFNKMSKGFHKIRCQRSVAPTRLMIETVPWEQARSLNQCIGVTVKHGVAKRQKGIERITRRATIAAFETDPTEQKSIQRTKEREFRILTGLELRRR